ncbi:MAG: rhodanese-like domain-containing protein [Halobacteriales archaeon]|nr:rhodanese-like domain-containing protein [Halobacteriales archaeon]
MTDEVDPDEVQAKLGSGEEVQIVDIRSPAEYAGGHIPGAINIPFAHLPREIDRHEWGSDVVVVCPIGESSIQAARLIESYEGVPDDATVASMRGGYADWEGDLEVGADEAEGADAGSESPF